MKTWFICALTVGIMGFGGTAKSSELYGGVGKINTEEKTVRELRKTKKDYTLTDDKVLQELNRRKTYLMSDPMLKVLMGRYKRVSHHKKFVKRDLMRMRETTQYLFGGRLEFHCARFRRGECVRDFHMEFTSTN